MVANAYKVREAGAALVETVVVTPLLLFLILLTAEITNAFVDHNTLTKAARSGARYLAATSILGTTGNVLLTSDLVTRTRNLVVYGSPTGTGASLLPGLSPTNVQVVDLGGNVIQVSVTYPYTGLLGGSLPGMGFGSSISLDLNLQATVMMRAL